MTELWLFFDLCVSAFPVFLVQYVMPFFHFLAQFSLHLPVVLFNCAPLIQLSKTLVVCAINSPGQGVKTSSDRLLVVCFIALHPKSTAMVMVGRSVHLTTLFPGQA